MRIYETSNFSINTYKFINDEYILVVYSDYKRCGTLYSRLYRLSDTKVLYTNKPIKMGPALTFLPNYNHLPSDLDDTNKS